MITIRKEASGDEEQIRNLNTRAFGRTAEGEIVDARLSEVLAYE
jgi:predicted N-acetyltransferase YhbS